MSSTSSTSASELQLLSFPLGVREVGQLQQRVEVDVVDFAFSSCCCCSTFTFFHQQCVRVPKPLLHPRLIDHHLVAVLAAASVLLAPHLQREHFNELEELAVVIKAIAKAERRRTHAAHSAQCALRLHHHLAQICKHVARKPSVIRYVEEAAEPWPLVQQHMISSTKAASTAACSSRPS